MTTTSVRRGRLLLLVIVLCAGTIVGALWLRAATIDTTTDRICDKVDALTAALVATGTEGRALDKERRERIHDFIEKAACDPDNLKPLLQGGSS